METQCIAIETEAGHYVGETLQNGWCYHGGAQIGNHVEVGLEGWPTRLDYVITEIDEEHVRMESSGLADLSVSIRTGKAMLNE